MILVRVREFVHNTTVCSLYHGESESLFRLNSSCPHIEVDSIILSKDLEILPEPGPGGCYYSDDPYAEECDRLGKAQFCSKGYAPLYGACTRVMAGNYSPYGNESIACPTARFSGAFYCKLPWYVAL